LSSRGNARTFADIIVLELGLRLNTKSFGALAFLQAFYTLVFDPIEADFYFGTYFHIIGIPIAVFIGKTYIFAC